MPKCLNLSPLVHEGCYPGGGGGYSQKSWVWVCRLFPKTLILFKAKFCDFPYPICDLTKSFKPYLRVPQFRQVLKKMFMFLLGKMPSKKTYLIQD